MFSSRFTEVEQLGSGSFSEVYRSRDSVTGELVAIKRLKAGVGAPEITRHEFDLAASLSHSALISLYELYSEPEQEYFSMEYCEGSAFGADIQISPVEYVQWILPTVIEGIAVLHKNGIVHCDIKPSNIVVGDEVKVLDFGLGLRTALANSSAMELTGTPAFMAPEIFQGIITPESDWYSLGAVVYEVIVGSPPFPEGAKGYISKFRGDFLAIEQMAHAVPEKLASSVNRMLSVDPDRRPSDEELLSDFAMSGWEKRIYEASKDSGTLESFGRSSELNSLKMAYGMSSEKSTVVLLSGDSGHGKSTLLKAFKEHLKHFENTRLLNGFCNPKRMVPFGLFDNVASELARVGELSNICHLEDLACLGNHFPNLAQYSDLGYAPGIVSGEALSEFYTAFSQVLVQLARHKVVVILLDDVQWVDRDSAKLLEALLLELPTNNVMFVLSGRDECQNRSPLPDETLGVLKANRAALNLQKIYLSQFGFHESMQFLEAKNVRLAKDSLAEIANCCNGSPYLISEVVSYLDSGGGFKGDDIGLGQIVLSRLHRYSDEVKRFVQLMSLAAAPLDFSAVAQRLGLTLESIKQLESDRLIRRTSGYKFVIYHDALNQVVKVMFDDLDLKKSHVLLAECFEEANEPASILFHHWREAGDDNRSTTYALAAGRGALEKMAFESASYYFSVALDAGYWSEDEAADIREQYGLALFNAGRVGEASLVLEECAASINDVSTKTRLLTIATEANLVAGFIDKGYELGNNLLQSIGVVISNEPKTFEDMIGVLSGLTPLSKSQSDITEREHAQVSDLLWVLSRGMIHLRPIEAVGFLQLSIAHAVSCGDDLKIGRGLSLAVGQPYAEDAYLAEKYDEYLTKIELIVDETDDAYLAAMLKVWKSFRMFSLGEWSDLKTLSHQGVKQLRANCPGTFWERMTASNMYLMAMRPQGHIRGIRNMAWRWILESERQGNLYAQVTFRQNLIVAALMEGNSNEARSHIEWIRDSWTEKNTVPHFYCNFYEAYCFLLDGHIDEAISRAEILHRQFVRSGGYSNATGAMQFLPFLACLKLRAEFNQVSCEGIPSIDNLTVAMRTIGRKDASVYAELFNLCWRSQISKDLSRDYRECGAKFRAVNVEVYALLCDLHAADISGDSEETAQIASIMQRLGFSSPESFLLNFGPRFVK